MKSWIVTQYFGFILISSFSLNGWSDIAQQPNPTHTRTGQLNQFDEESINQEAATVHQDVEQDSVKSKNSKKRHIKPDSND